MTMPYVKIFPDFISIAEALDNGERGKLFLAILQYANGKEIDKLTGGTLIAWLGIKNQIDRDTDAYTSFIEKQRKNGAKGGRPKNPTVINENPENPTVFLETQKTQEKEKEEDKDKEEEVVVDDYTTTIRIFTENTSIRNLTPASVDSIKHWCDIAGHDLVRKAITYCVKNKGRDISWGYIEKPLKEWHERGLKAEDVDAYVQRNAKTQKVNPALNYQQRNYKNGELDDLFVKM